MHNISADKENKKDIFMKKNISIFALITILFTLSACSGGHKHTFYDEWNYDDEYHWHDASCEHEDVVGNKGKHQGEYVIVEPTIREDGYKYLACSICGYRMSGDEPTGDRATGTVDKLEFVLNEEEDEYAVKCLDNTIIGEVIIPAAYKNLPVTSIAKQGFYQCPNITSVTIPNSIKTIEESAFFYCLSLRTVLFDTGSLLNKIEDFAFLHCPSLKNINLPNSLSYIGKQALQECGFSSINLPNNITVISVGLFHSCISLTSIKIPNGVTTIESEAFAKCNSLSSVTLPEGITKIDNLAFSYCNSLTYIAIPDSVSELGEGVFSHSEKLDRITLPSNVKNIPNSLFNGCKGLTSVAFSSIETIGDYAFLNCSSLVSLSEIPNTIEEVGVDAFKGCEEISVKVFDNGEYLGNSQNPYLVLIRPLSSVKVNNFTSIVTHDNCKIIAGGVFCDYYYLENASISSSIKYIGKMAFLGSKLTTFTFPEGVKVINGSVLSSCFSLLEINIPSTVTFIASHAFSSCEALAKIVYNGTKQEWYNIEKEDYWNNNCPKLHLVQCSDGDTTM